MLFSRDVPLLIGWESSNWDDWSSSTALERGWKLSGVGGMSENDSSGLGRIMGGESKISGSTTLMASCKIVLSLGLYSFWPSTWKLVNWVVDQQWQRSPCVIIIKLPGTLHPRFLMEDFAFENTNLILKAHHHFCTPRSVPNLRIWASKRANCHEKIPFAKGIYCGIHIFCVTGPWIAKEDWCLTLHPQWLKRISRNIRDLLEWL